jgi:uncharacterized membrane protein
LLAWIRFFLSGVCHQLPERCLVYEGQPLPLCARCTGAFLGIIIGFITLRAIGQGRRSQLPTWRPSLVLAFLVGLWAVDGFNSLVQLVIGKPWLYEPRNSLRLITGMGTGLAVSVLLYPIYHYSMWRQVDARRVLDREWPMLALLFAGAACISLIWRWSTAPFWFWVAIVSLAVVVVLATTNAMLIVLALKKEGLADSWIQIVPYLAMGLLAGIVEMGVLALLRLWITG